jgi:hypothetical protein
VSRAASLGSRLLRSPAARVIPGIGTIGAIGSIVAIPGALRAGSAALGVARQPIRALQRAVPGGMTGMECPKGYHWSKHSGKCVRNRRMNPMNGRAASRAIRRIKAAEKMLKRIFTVSHGGPQPKVTPKRRK